MKYLLLLGDGMADKDLKELGNKTPLDVANKPLINEYAKKGIMGMVKTVPDAYKPGSDVANLSLMGYAPDKFYTGRSPLEAVNIGVKLKDDDIAIRCNLVSLSEEESNYEDKTMVDYSSSEISTEEADELIKYLEKNLKEDDLHFYTGTSYRHCVVINKAKNETDYTPPHDISLKKITSYMPVGYYGERFTELMKKSYDLLVNHPINIERKKKGLNPANSIWLWGEGRKPRLENFYKLFNKKAAVISAVDLIKGIGLCAEMSVIDVEGATGTLSTNYENKAKACIDAFLNGYDFVYLHVEASDECGHQGDLKGKIKAIENLNYRLLEPITKALKEHNEDLSVLVSPDHPTPISTRTHDRSPIPFVIYRSTDDTVKNENAIYCEKDAEKTKIFFDNGPDLLKFFFSDKNSI